MLNMVCLACLPKSPVLKSSIYKLQSCSCFWKPHSPSAKYGVCYVFAQRSKFSNSEYINCSPVVSLGCLEVYLLNMVCLACLPKLPNSQIQCIQIVVLQLLVKAIQLICQIWCAKRVCLISNPFYINCGNVVLFEILIVHLENRVCLACLPRVPNSQINKI